MRWSIIDDYVRFSFRIKSSYEGFENADYYFAVDITLDDIRTKGIISFEKA